jgi:NADH dehydrogenase FAD-containing subunit
MRERKRILLIGAGHAHIVVLRHFAKHRPDAEIIFVNDTEHAWYTGALPALIRGSIKPENARLNLDKLASAAGAKFIPATYHRHCEEQSDEAIHLTSERLLTAYFTNHAPIACDVLSLSIGAAKTEYGIKPIPEFLHRLAQWETEQKPKIGIIGSGASGLETAFSIRIRLGKTAEIYIQSRNGILLPHAPRKAQKVAARALENANIKIVPTLPEGLDAINAYTAEPSIEITNTLTLARSTSLRAQRSNPSCAQQTGTIFATGDTAKFPHPLPRSGAIAVHQGRTLAYNLTHDHPKTFKPPAATLAILSLNNHQAIAWYGNFSCSGCLPMLLKNFLDKKWLTQ